MSNGSNLLKCVETFHMHTWNTYSVLYFYQTRDRSLGMLVSNSLTNWYDLGVWRCLLKTSTMKRLEYSNNHSTIHLTVSLKLLSFLWQYMSPLVNIRVLQQSLHNSSDSVIETLGIPQWINLITAQTVFCTEVPCSC